MNEWFQWNSKLPYIPGCDYDVVWHLYNIKSLIQNQYIKLQKLPSIGVLRKGILKIYRKFTGEHSSRGVISINLLCWNTPRHGCSHVNLLHIFITPFYNSTYWGLLLKLPEVTLKIKFVLFASLKALWKWFKMLFISS